MSRPLLVAEPPQERSRPSVCLNMIEGDTMLTEYREQEIKIETLIVQLQIANKIAADLRLHLQLAGKL